MWRIGGSEMNLAPEDFQAQLTYLGGTNRFDEPNFVIWWSQYAYGHGSFRAGGVWSVEGAYFKGYRDLLKGSGEPCWSLGQWNPPELYGTPERYYVDGFDEATGLQQIGEFPYCGRVEILWNLRWHEVENGKITFHTMPLSTTTFDSIIPIIIAAKDISIEKRKAAYLAAREAEEAAKLGDVERHLRDKEIPFTGGVSFTRQGIRSTVIDEKMRKLQRTWAQRANAAKGFKPGLQTR
jgi:hypothetical protein